jgi:hypothetical protein
MTSLTALLNKLTEIEHSIGRADDLTIRHMVMDAQDCALELQKELMEVLLKESREKSGKLNMDGFL